MEEVLQEIRSLFATAGDSAITLIEKLPQSGSDRVYFRVHAGHDTCIATYNLHVKENRTFIYFSTHFKELQLPVPSILAVNQDETIYLQEDVGTVSLLDMLEQHGYCNMVYGLFEKSLQQLAQIQVLGHVGMDYTQSLTAKEFGRQAILSDLLYFKYYFLDTLRLPYDKQGLLDDFDALAFYLTKTEYKFFMFRDFQSRNIMVKEGNVYFIDYQGGMQGALQYDVASLLWQAKAQLSEAWKDGLFAYYMNEVDKLLEKPIDRNIFTGQYYGYVLIRLLQVLGAYGFRGLFERKAHFLASIPLALTNLKWFTEHKKAGIALPEFERILNRITQDDIIERFTPVLANEATPLVVQVKSFSYKKGIPVDGSGNGGGFVFDCRGVHNPGRYDAYKKLSGTDRPVQDFLEQQTKMNDFLNSVFDIVDISAEDYIKRNFESLQVCFGCTGGQHRSVYAAEQTARHLRNKYKVKVLVEHCNKDNWVR